MTSRSVATLGGAGARSRAARGCGQASEEEAERRRSVDAAAGRVSRAQRARLQEPRDGLGCADAEPDIGRHNQRARRHEKQVAEKPVAVPGIVGFQRAVTEAQGRGRDQKDRQAGLPAELVESERDCKAETSDGEQPNEFEFQHRLRPSRNGGES